MDESLELPDYSGPFKADLRFSDFSDEALISMYSLSYEYYVLLVESWSAEVASRYGEDAKDELQLSAWTNGIVPHLDRIAEEYEAIEEVDVLPALDHGVVAFNPFKPDPRLSECDKERLVNLCLGSHEFLLLVIEAWAAEVVVRYGLDEMFDIQWTLWSEKVLPEIRNMKGRWMNITTNDVAAFMKDIQIDATSFPGKAFELTFEMPEEDVGIMTFNRCCAPDQWEALGRPGHPGEELPLDVPGLADRDGQDVQPEHEGRHPGHPAARRRRATCAASGSSACATRSDPEYVPVELGRKPGT